MAQVIGQGFESLEERTLLAVNVTATLVGDTLIIDGDATNNSIDVYGDGTDGDVTVNTNGQGLFVAGGSLDESNQGSFTGVKNIVIRGNVGDDSIHVADINIDGSLSVQGGLGTDYISLHTHQFDTYIGGSVVLNGGLSLNDSIDVQTLGYGEDLTIGGGLAMVNHGGYGRLLLDAAYGNISIGGGVLMNTFSLLGSYGSAEIRSDYGNLTVGGSVWMNGGAGDDLLGIFAGYGATAYGTSKTGVTINGGVVMNGGWGDDQLLIAAYGYGVFGYGYGAPSPAPAYGFTQIQNNMSIGGDVQMVAGVGNDLVSVRAIGADVAIHGSLNQFGGFGDDTLLTGSSSYGTVSVGGNALADGGDGNDHISAYGMVVSGGAMVLGGSGDDGIDLDSNTVNNGVWIFGQLGNDTVCAENNTVNNGGVFAAGGLGFDQIYAANNEINGPVFEVGFEQVLEFCPFDETIPPVKPSKHV